MNKQLITYIGAHHGAMESIYNLSYQLGKQTCLLRNSPVAAIRGVNFWSPESVLGFLHHT